MGLGLPYENVAWPRSVPRLVWSLREAGVAAEELEFHPHNDTHLVVANCLAAIQAGCAVVNGTLLGKGERTGNAPLEAILLHAAGMGCLPALPDFHALGELASLYEELGEPVPPKYPLYGRDAHRIHPPELVEAVGVDPRARTRPSTFPACSAGRSSSASRRTRVSPGSSSWSSSTRVVSPRRTTLLSSRSTRSCCASSTRVGRPRSSGRRSRSFSPTPRPSKRPQARDPSGSRLPGADEHAPDRADEDAAPGSGLGRIAPVPRWPGAAALHRS